MTKDDFKTISNGFELIFKNQIELQHRFEGLFNHYVTNLAAIKRVDSEIIQKEIKELMKENRTIVSDKIYNDIKTLFPDFQIPERQK